MCMCVCVHHFVHFIRNIVGEKLVYGLYLLVRGHREQDWHLRDSRLEDTFPLPAAKKNSSLPVPNIVS